MDLRPGAVVACFQVLRVAGAGNRATVYQAYDVQQQRFVALKVLHVEFDGSIAADEHIGSDVAAITGLAGRQHIAEVYSVGQIESSVFLVTEFVHGVDLGRLPPPLDARLGLKIATATARALDTAHDAGVIHGALKPSNVMLSRDGRILVTDFGLASLVARLAPQVPQPDLVPFLAPELATGAAHSPASDQYALAALAHWILAGGVPEDCPGGAGPYATALRSAAAGAAPGDAPLPPAAKEVLARALSEVPEQRYANCVAFVASLARAIRPWPMLAHKPTDPPRDVLLRRAREHIAAEDFHAARAALAATARLFPGDHDVDELVAAVEQEGELARRYETARLLLHRSEWFAARELLRAIQAQHPGYRDVATLYKQTLSEIRRHWERQARMTRDGTRRRRQDYDPGERGLGREAGGLERPLIVARHPVGSPWRGRREGTSGSRAGAGEESAAAQPTGPPAEPAMAWEGQRAGGLDPHAASSIPSGISYGGLALPDAAAADASTTFVHDVRAGHAESPALGDHAAPGRAREEMRVRPASGRFMLQARADGLYVTVWPPESGGQTVQPSEIMDALARWTVPRASAADIRRAIRDVPGQAVRLSPPVWSVVPCGEHRLAAIVTPDQMTALLATVGEPPPRPAQPDAVVAALAKVGVTHGISRSDVATFCRQRSHRWPVVVARGTAPSDGPAELEYLFPRVGADAPDVAPGTLLARATFGPAACGCTVTGAPIYPTAALRSSLEPFVGEGAALAEHPECPGGGAMVAAAYGRPTVIGGRVAVLPYDYVPDVLDGAARFTGSVTLVGMASGARVHARGDVAVEGNVGHVVVEAGGSVRLRGVDGAGRARVAAGAGIRATWIRGCLLMARDAIDVDTELVGATVLAAQRVRLLDDGVISGGLVRATEEIVAARIAAGEEATATRIILGSLTRRPGAGSTARLIVTEALEAGVRVTIDGATLEVDELLSNVLITQVDGSLRVEPCVA